MVKYCYCCGNELDLTNFNVYWCSNCGKLVGNQEPESKESDDDNERNYIG